MNYRATTSHAGRALSAALALLTGTVAGHLSSWAQPRPSDERFHQTAPLRLDDSPSLPLLEPYRHAAGKPASQLRCYLEGPYGQWHIASWQTVIWYERSSHTDRITADRWIDGHFTRSRCGTDLLGLQTCSPSLGDPDALMLNSPDDMTTSGLNVDVDLLAGLRHGKRRHPWLARHLSGLPLWPYTAPDWFFQPSAFDREQPLKIASLDISGELVPPWLTRIDGSWAQVLLLNAGCGRGGACSMATSFPANAFEELWTALAPEYEEIPEWKCRQRQITIMRHGSERDAFQRLVKCDGSVSQDSIERLSLLARPPGVERPKTLPEEPAPGAECGEWVPQIRLVNPRLLWLLQRIADEFPWRWIYIYSGYRRPEGKMRRGTHRSLHWEGRALDITVQGVENEELLELCRKLPDVGCGYYPHRKFIHVDVRPRGFGQAFWIDASRPGENVKYVDSWPGVVENGAMVWSKHKVKPSASDLEP